MDVVARRSCTSGQATTTSRRITGVYKLGLIAVALALTLGACGPKRSKYPQNVTVVYPPYPPPVYMPTPTPLRYPTVYQ